MEILRDYRHSLVEKQQAELQDRYRRALETVEDGSCPKRDVTPVWRLCVADSMDQSGSGVSLFFYTFDKSSYINMDYNQIQTHALILCFSLVLVYQLNLWRPPSDLQSLLKEGCRFKVYNLTTSDFKKHGGSAAVQLTGTKRTQFEDLPVGNYVIHTKYSYRIVDMVSINWNNV